MNRLLTAQEATEYLRIHVNTIYIYLETGKLKGHRVIGNRWRIKAQDLEAFINEQGARLDNAELGKTKVRNGC